MKPVSVPKRKVKYTAGKAHKSRCPAKKLGSKCECGQYGKKSTTIPYMFKVYPLHHFSIKTLAKVRKWRKKESIKKIRLYKYLQSDN